MKKIKQDGYYQTALNKIIRGEKLFEEDGFYYYQEDGGYYGSELCEVFEIEAETYTCGNYIYYAQTDWDNELSIYHTVAVEDLGEDESALKQRAQVIWLIKSINQ